jgi:thioredoxin 2
MNSEEAHIIRCSGCGARNRIPGEKPGMQAKCGKCGAHLGPDGPGKRDSSTEVFVFRCHECGTKNRVPGQRIRESSRCGKCGSTLRTEDLFEPQPLRVTDGNFQEKILKSPLPALVFAWAPWCPTCRAFIPVIDSYGKDSKGKVRVGKLNVDENPGLSSTFSILSVPQILIFEKGQLKETLPGSMQKQDIQQKMTHYT